MVLATEQDDYMQGWTQGLMDAQPNTAWAAAGIGCGVFAVGAAYTWDYQPSIMSLVGKSPEFIVAYTEAYRQKMRNENTRHAAIGWGVSTAFLLAIYYLSRDDYYY
jgi:hypothetical protein